MSQKPNPNDQDHWMDIAGQLGPNSSNELDDYFSGASAESLESIDSILKEVQAKTDEPVAESTSEPEQNDLPTTESNDVSVDSEGEEDVLNIDWGTSTNVEAQQTISVKQFDPVQQDGLPDLDAGNPTTSIESVKPAHVDAPALDSSGSVDSWDLLANDLGLENGSLASVDTDEDDENSMFTFEEPKIESDTVAPVSSEQNDNPILKESPAEPHTEKSAEEVANDVLSQMFAFGEPTRSTEPESTTKEPKDAGENESDEVEPLGFASFADAPARDSKPVDSASVVETSEGDDDFIEFEIESLSESSEPARKKRPRRREDRRTESRRTKRGDKDRNAEVETSDIDEAKDDQSDDEGRRPPRARRKKRSERDEKRSRDDRPRNKQRGDENDEQSAGNKDSRKSSETKTRKRDDKESGDKKKKKIPTWDEAISQIIDTNLSSRKKSSGNNRKRKRRS